jgi:tripartite-type tricarboxylate transporter receptor subunit TctC
MKNRSAPGGAVLRPALLILASVLGLMTSAQADPIADFYKGREIVLIVGSGPGGGYDLLARLVARRLGDFIPGHPSVVVQNMPGAGSVLMSNHIYNTAPQDGTVIGLVQNGVLLSQVLGQSGVHYQTNKFNWIGSVSSETSMVVSWAAAPIKSFSDLQTRGMVVGGTGATSNAESGARMLNAVAQTKLKIVSGYPGTADVLLAMQRGEVEGDIDLSWSEMKVKNAGLLAANKLRLLAQDSLSPAADLPDVPLIGQFIKDTPSRDTFALYADIKSVARPIMAGPKVPPERVAALRRAFQDMVSSATFKADAAKEKLDLDPKDHRAIESYLAQVSASSPATIARLRGILVPHQK